MSEFRADLHCHTTCSDGTSSPQELIELAVEKGLSGLSITDHDTIEAYKTAFAIAEKLGLPLIPGVEFSAVQRQTSVHILAYSFNLNSPLIEEFCSQHNHQRNQRNKRILDLLATHDMPLTADDIQDPSLSFQQTTGRPHIAAAMIKKGYVSTIKEAFSKYIGEDRPCFSMGEYFSVEETIDLIHRAKGLAVIAHPHLINNGKIVEDLLQMPFDGIEGYYGRFFPSQQARWVKMGEKKGWLITGGSDFHGTIKPNLSLGCSWINEETFSQLNNHFKQNQSL